MALAVAWEDSGEIAVAEVGEMVVGQAEEHAVLERACSELAIGVVVLVDKPAAFEDAVVAVEAVDVEVVDAEGVDAEAADAEAVDAEVVDVEAGVVVEGVE